jgi:hypothetical protein
MYYVSSAGVPLSLSLNCLRRIVKIITVQCRSISKTQTSKIHVDFGGKVYSAQLTLLLMHLAKFYQE